MKFETRTKVFAAVAVIFIILSVILGVISLATIDKNEKRIAELEAQDIELKNRIYTLEKKPENYCLFYAMVAVYHNQRQIFKGEATVEIKGEFCHVWNTFGADIAYFNLHDSSYKLYI